jgi:hypothetical protein
MRWGAGSAAQLSEMSCPALTVRLARGGWSFGTITRLEERTVLARFVPVTHGVWIFAKISRALQRGQIRWKLFIFGQIAGG